MERAPRQPRLGLRGPGWAAAGAVLLGLVGASAARSDPDFGTLGLNRTTFGSVVSLVTPAAGLAQPADEFVVERDVLQSENADPGLIQAGVYRSGSGISLDNCGPHAAYAVFTEVKAANSMAYGASSSTTSLPGRSSRSTSSASRVRHLGDPHQRRPGRPDLPARLLERGAGDRIRDRGRRLRLHDAPGDPLRAGRARTVDGLHACREVPPLRVRAAIRFELSDDRCPLALAGPPGPPDDPPPPVIRRRLLAWPRVVLVAAAIVALVLSVGGGGTRTARAGRPSIAAASSAARRPS